MDNQNNTQQPQDVQSPITSQDVAASSQVSDPALKAYLEQVEKALLDEIVSQLKNKQITVEESQATAKDFLSLLPPKDKEDLLKKLYTLSKKHPKEGLGVYLKFAEPELEQDKKQSLDQIANLIHNGNIEEALRVAKEENS